MGKISDSMQNVVDEIRSSTEVRGAALEELLDETKQLMRDIYNANQTQANALRDRLSSDEKARSSDEKERLEATQKFVEQVGVKVSEIRSGSHNHVEQSRLERQDMSKTLKDKLSSDERARTEATRQFMDKVHSAGQTQANALRDKLSSDMKAGVETTREFMDKVHSGRQTQANALRDKLSSDEKARTEATRQFMEATRQFMDEIRKTNNEHRETVRKMLGEIASDLRQASQMWAEIGGKKIAPEAAPEEVVEEVEKKPEVEAVPPISNREKILEVVGRNPEGIKLVDIGNKLGVNWRGLIVDVKFLVDEDRVEKIDNMYYPKKEE